ncbi:hypothetical protein [Acidovorax sp. Leaf160]|uniref:hypothetical protein n=1 Tax=Acidovorax sp. Leaf160 TaxID=1736280 RepID=UPI0006FCF08B|nr:hypothetical protein [Acidovorax sp. Leaf160]KQR55544.1 hypothetical protein ASF94_03770 [Acidovorax sp. Leaf160]
MKSTTSASAQQETVFGVADGATYSGMLCLRDDGRYYFSQAQVDGHNLPMPDQQWASRDEAVKALAGMASGSLPAQSTQPSSAS